MSSLSRIGAFSLAVALAGTTIAAQGKQEPGREAGTKPKTGVSSLVEGFERERARAPEKYAAKRDARSFKRLKVDGKKLEFSRIEFPARGPVRSDLLIIENARQIAPLLAEITPHLSEPLDTSMKSASNSWSLDFLMGRPATWVR